MLINLDFEWQFEIVLKSLCKTIVKMTYVYVAAWLYAWRDGLIVGTRVTWTTKLITESQCCFKFKTVV